MAKVNKHLDHLEDRIILEGTKGGEEALNVLVKMGQMLSGKPGVNVAVTTKWDGAPAVVCGIDPSDNRFFVGTKSVFNKVDPKICKTSADVQKFYNGALAAKLTDCLTYLDRCVTSGVLQGDLMFTDDKKMITINNERLLSFRPNTITYAVNPATPLGEDIQQAKIGIVFHTKYTGDNLANMSASFDVKEKDFKTGGEVWAERATFQDIGGVASFAMDEKIRYDAMVRKARGSLKQCKGILDEIQTGKRALQIDTEFLKFFNNYVKQGVRIPSVDKAYTDFMAWVSEQFNKEFGKAKTDKTVSKKAEQWAQITFFLMKNEKRIKMLIATFMNLSGAKMILVNKMKQVSYLRLFVDKGGGDYEATTPEGFVAISGDKATKLVDRMEFSKLNFTIPKVW